MPKRNLYLPILILFIPKLKKFNDVQTIKSVVVKSKYRGNPELARIDELDKFYTTGMFSGTVKGYLLNVIDDSMAKAIDNIFDYVRFRAPGVRIITDAFGFKHFVAEEFVSVAKKQLSYIPVYLDETISETAALNSLAASDVAYIKYLPGVVIGGSFRSNIGAVYVYTKKGTEKGPPGKGLPYVYIKGYNSQQEFSSPDYSDKDLLKEPDLRSTLYWNPNLILDKTNNKIKIGYYNNDVSRKLLLTIEGVNERGKLIHIEKIIE